MKHSERNSSQANAVLILQCRKQAFFTMCKVLNDPKNICKSFIKIQMNSCSFVLNFNVGLLLKCNGRIIKNNISISLPYSCISLQAQSGPSTYDMMTIQLKLKVCVYQLPPAEVITVSLLTRRQWEQDHNSESETVLNYT